MPKVFALPENFDLVYCKKCKVLLTTANAGRQDEQGNSYLQELICHACEGKEK